MFIIRPIRQQDLKDFEEFANKSSLGLINLPKNREVLKEKIKASEHAFEKSVEQPEFENYIFVLEDTTTGELGGTCGITSRMGIIEPNYYFRLITTKNPYTQKDQPILTPVCYPIGPTEMCALYVKADFRREGLGKLLSLSRFLFIASYSQRFDDFVVAEMRGYIKDENYCVFWENVCRKFLDITYAELCEKELVSRAFIPEIMPRWPLYVALLPKEAQDCIAKTHDKTLPALNMLQKEGFAFTGEIDPFDGGPKIGCKTSDIATIKRSQRAIVESVTSNLTTSRNFLISNVSIEFRACYGDILLLKPGLVSIAREVAQALNVAIGDKIRFVQNFHSNP